MPTRGYRGLYVFNMERFDKEDVYNSVDRELSLEILRLHSYFHCKTIEEEGRTH